MYDTYDAYGACERCVWKTKTVSQSVASCVSFDSAVSLRKEALSSVTVNAVK